MSGRRQAPAGVPRPAAGDALPAQGAEQHTPTPWLNERGCCELPSRANGSLQRPGHCSYFCKGALPSCPSAPREAHPVKPGFARKMSGRGQNCLTASFETATAGVRPHPGAAADAGEGKGGCVCCGADGRSRRARARCSAASLLLTFPLQTSLLRDYTLRVTVTHSWWLSPGREEIAKPILSPGLKIQPT